MHVIVIGAGMIGAAVAESLARRGVRSPFSTCARRAAARLRHRPASSLHTSKLTRHRRC
jgi:glycine/D-amino acid oxidase-like deaminating enzyme